MANDFEKGWDAFKKDVAEGFDKVKDVFEDAGDKIKDTYEEEKKKMEAREMGDREKALEEAKAAKAKQNQI